MPVLGGLAMCCSFGGDMPTCAVGGRLPQLCDRCCNVAVLQTMHFEAIGAKLEEMAQGVAVHLLF